MIATRFVQHLDLVLGHLSAASGLLLHGDHFLVVADDENELGAFPRDGGKGRLHRLLDGELPEAKAKRKARKADFEILLAVPGHGVLALGSGSRPTRERAVLLATSPDGEPVGTPRIIDTSPLCARLSEELPELNLEGAVLLGDQLVFLQRASRKDPRNALVFVPRDSLSRALETGVFEAPDAFDFTVAELGSHDGLPWTFTDAAALEDGDLLVTAVLEDTGNTYDDGACHGAALARLSPRGELHWMEQLGTTAKVEGIALERSGDSLRAWLVTDADDASVPAQLLCAEVP